MLDIAYRIGSRRAEEEALLKHSSLAKSLAAAGVSGSVIGSVGSQLSSRDDGSLFLDPKQVSGQAITEGAATGLGAMGGLAAGRTFGKGFWPSVLGMALGGTIAPTAVRNLGSSRNNVY
jgi:hypothetical protein